MSDLRVMLHAAAPAPRELDLDRLHQRGRHLRRRPRLAVAVLAVLVLASVAFVISRSGDGRSVPVSPVPTSRGPAPTTVTTNTAPAPEDPALSLPADVARCQARDLAFLDAQNQSGFLLLRFTKNGTRDCALLSYPRLSGRDAAGNWVEIATQPQAIDPVSSFAWTGLLTNSVPGNPPVVFRLQVVPPSAFVGSRCPTPELPARHFSGLRLELRDGGGTVELTDTPFDTGGCEIAITRFGYDSTDR